MRTYISMIYRLIDCGMPLERAVLNVTKAYGLTMREMEMLLDATKGT